VELYLHSPIRFMAWCLVKHMVHKMNLTNMRREKDYPRDVKDRESTVSVVGRNEGGCRQDYSCVVAPSRTD
jgi:hypothetical protein